MGHLWLRSEYKNLRKATPLIPVMLTLLNLGHVVTIEESLQRVYSVEEYRKVGCTIVPAGTWEYAPYDAYILGLKNLPDSHQSLRHKHIYFAHSFKEQLHSKWLLRRFRKGGGILYDLEYLIDNEKQRVAAFGYYAGVAGAAIALMIWAMKKQGKSAPYHIPRLYMNENEMIDDIHKMFHLVGAKPSVLIIGAKGRSGLGASYLIRRLGIQAVHWERKHTQNKNLNQQISQFEVMLNCIFVDESTPIFLTKEDLINNKINLSVISDISCEPDSKYHPLPFYKETTSFEMPTQAIGSVDLIAIDNLPSYLPVDSSIHFSGQLINHLIDLLSEDRENAVWHKAANTFNDYSLNYIIENRMANHYENTHSKKYYRYR